MLSTLVFPHRAATTAVVLPLMRCAATSVHAFCSGKQHVREGQSSAGRSCVHIADLQQLQRRVLAWSPCGDRFGRSHQRPGDLAGVDSLRRPAADAVRDAHGVGRGEEGVLAARCNLVRVRDRAPGRGEVELPRLRAASARRAGKHRRGFFSSDDGRRGRRAGARGGSEGRQAPRT